MIPDFKKSIDNILHERLSSPFFGAFLFSWCIWNWKIIYLTLFVSGDKISENKIDFIVKNYSEFNHLLLYPIFSTLFLILIYPLISTGAFWVTLKFNNLKNDIQNSEEKKLLLSIEKSIELREELRNQDEKFDKLLTRKNEEIELLKKEIINYKDQLKSINSSVSELPSAPREEIYQNEYELMKANETLYKEFEKIAQRAQKQYNMFYDGHTIDRKLFDYFLANDIIEKIGGTDNYKFTEKGKYFNKKRIDETLVVK